MSKRLVFNPEGLKAARLEKEWSLSQLCARLGEAGVSVSPQSVSAWERGKSVPCCEATIGLSMIIGPENFMRLKEQ